MYHSQEDIYGKIKIYLTSRINTCITIISHMNNKRNIVCIYYKLE